MKDTQAYLTDEESVIQFIRTGMDFHTSCLAAGISEEKEDALLEDEHFLRKVDVENAMLELTLLTRHDTACKIAEKRGSTSGVQWKLEKINPSRYSNKEKDTKVFTGKVNVNVIRGEDENLKKVYECPECDSRNIGENDKSIWCRDCKHKVEDKLEDTSFIRYEIRERADK